MLEVGNMWDRITVGDRQETDKSWAAFQIYRDMPLYGKKQEKRSYANLALITGHSGTTTIEGWSQKYHWVERCRAYDAHNGRQLAVVRQTGIEEYKERVISNLTQQVALADTIINEALQSLLTADEVDTKAINQLLLAIEKKDNLARRAAGMPTTFTSEQGKEAESDTIEYFVGPDNG